MSQTRSTAYRIVSYARAHDYGDARAGESPARYSDKWMNQSLRLVLDEITSTASTTSTSDTSLRLRITTSPDHDVYASASQAASRGETYEDLDLTLYQRLLKESPPLVEQNGYPIRVVYRGTQVVFRYQMPAAIPMPRGVAVAYRRFQLIFADDSDVHKVIQAIKTYCHCSDQSDAAKAQATAKKSKHSFKQTTVVPSSSQSQQIYASNHAVTDYRPNDSFHSAPRPSSYFSAQSQPLDAVLPVPASATFALALPNSSSTSWGPIHHSSHISSPVSNRPQSAMAPPKPVSLPHDIPRRPSTTAFGPPSNRLPTDVPPQADQIRDYDRARFSNISSRAPSTTYAYPASTSSSVMPSASDVMAIGNIPDVGGAGPPQPVQFRTQSYFQPSTSAYLPVSGSTPSSSQNQTAYATQGKGPSSYNMHGTAPAPNSVFHQRGEPGHMDLNAVLASLRATSGRNGGLTMLRELMNNPKDLQKVVLEMLNDPDFVQLVDSISSVLAMQ